MKKNRVIIFIALLFFCYPSIAFCYEFVNPENESKVDKLITQINDVKDLYEELVGDYEAEYTTINNASSDAYWWPIGSMDVVESNGKKYAKGNPETMLVSSSFGYRLDPFGSGKTTYHSGIDITGGRGANKVAIIAAKDGVVVYPSSSAQTQCPSSSSKSTCGGGYGNYVIIQHSDGNYTLYAHMYQNSITVMAGESVVQGQIIGYMGSSGNSTGTHLHFEIREGQNAYSSSVEPLNYISIENPRIVQESGNLLLWLNSWEGTTSIKGSNYVVENIGDGVRTVGAGVTLENNVSKFSEYGIDVNDYPVGSLISIDIVNKIEQELINEKRSYIEKTIAASSITLEENQIEALVSQIYNIGNINGFTNAYINYGNSKELYDNWFFRGVSKGSKFEKGLTRRRNAEWSLFNSAEYVYNR